MRLVFHKLLKLFCDFSLFFFILRGLSKQVDIAIAWTT